MQRGALLLIGEHDFSAFRAASARRAPRCADCTRCSVERHGDWVTIEVTANAFLHHMVRNIVGLLLAIGRGELPPERAREQLESRRTRSGEATAAAQRAVPLAGATTRRSSACRADSAMIGPRCLDWP